MKLRKPDYLSKKQNGYKMKQQENMVHGNYKIRW